MKTNQLHQQLAEKALTADQLAQRAFKQPVLITTILDGLDHAKADVKYPCGKALRVIVDEEPELLYPYFDVFASMLDSSNKIMSWEAIYIIAGLAAVDEEDKISAVWKSYFRPIEGPEMITAANIVKGHRVLQSHVGRWLSPPSVRSFGFTMGNMKPKSVTGL